MAYLFTGEELAQRHIDVCDNYKTIYMYAAYLWQVTDESIRIKAAQNLQGWYTKAHIEGLRAVANRTPPVWGADCVNLTEGILWGWGSDLSKLKGGAIHASNGVPDTNANGMIQLCRDVSTDFSTIEIGEGLWIEGHWGLYVGGGFAIECTGRWKNGVQRTAVLNIGKRAGYEGRYWTKHGKLPWVQYAGQPDQVEAEKIALGSRVIKKGTQGTDVRELQEMLIALGYPLPTYGADGDAGKETITALKRFQTHAGLEADGEAGPMTIAAMRSASAAQAAPAPANPMDQRYTLIIYDVPEAEKDAMLARWPRAEVVKG